MDNRTDAKRHAQADRCHYQAACVSHGVSEAATDAVKITGRTAVDSSSSRAAGETGSRGGIIARRYYYITPSEREERWREDPRGALFR